MYNAIEFSSTRDRRIEHIFGRECVGADLKVVAADPRDGGELQDHRPQPSCEAGAVGVVATPGRDVVPEAAAPRLIMNLMTVGFKTLTTTIMILIRTVNDRKKQSPGRGLTWIRLRGALWDRS